MDYSKILKALTLIFTLADYLTKLFKKEKPKDETKTNESLDIEKSI